MDIFCFKRKNFQIENIDCLCHKKRKTNKKEGKRILAHQPDNKNSNYTNTVCSFILCEKNITEIKRKNAICGGKKYSFCSDDCWSEWLNSPNNILHFAVTSPLNSYSPEYFDYFKNNNNIPPLFI
jgi:hypothetical protein